MDGCTIDRPGWIRMSIHPTMTNDEINFICDAIIEIAKNHKNWSGDYFYESSLNEYVHNGRKNFIDKATKDFFIL
jgi:hypothetical protein